MTETLTRAEFHCHTIWSKDSLLSPADLVAACRKKGIGQVVITDHNAIGGALQAKALDPDLVVVGEEILTTRGELLAAFVTEEIPAGLEPDEVIDRLRGQGAFISIAHPFNRHRSGAWKKEDVDRIIDRVDAVEVFNSRCWFAADNEVARQYALQHGKPGTAGSDAHAAFELGRGMLEIAPFHSAEELRRNVESARVKGTVSSRWVHLVSRWAEWKKKITHASTLVRS